MQTFRPTDPGYPRRLRQIAGPPSLLYVLGTVGEHEHSVAVVGSRAASKARVDLAYDWGSALADHGIRVVSGGAVGIDAGAHRGALASGNTVAVLANGLDVAYPDRHRELFRDIVDRGGALATTYKEGTPPLPHHFVRRNQIVAGLADVVVVIEAGARSGALHTARAARRQGRQVAALPGSAGTDWLIATGASMVESSDDVLATLQGRPKRPAIDLPPAGSERNLVLRALQGAVGRSPDELSHDTGLHPRRVNQHLIGLELSGLAMALPGRSGYVQSPLAHELLAAQE